MHRPGLNRHGASRPCDIGPSVGTVLRDRMSIQYKHRPDYGVVVRPLDAFTGPADPPAYAPLNTGPEYVAVLRSILGS